MSRSGDLRPYVPNMLPIQDPFPRLAEQLELAKRGESKHAPEDIERLIAFHKLQIQARETRWQEINHRAVERLLTTPVEAFRDAKSLPSVRDVIDVLAISESPLLTANGLAIPIGSGAIVFGKKPQSERVLLDGEWIGTDNQNVWNWRSVERTGKKGSIPSDVFESARTWWRSGQGGPSPKGGRPQSDGTGVLRPEVLVTAIHAYMQEYGAPPAKQEPFSHWLIDHLGLTYGRSSIPRTVARAIDATGLSFHDLVMVALTDFGAWSAIHIEE